MHESSVDDPEDKADALRLYILQQVKELGNASTACREAVIS